MCSCVCACVLGVAAVAVAHTWRGGDWTLGVLLHCSPAYSLAWALTALGAYQLAPGIFLSLPVLPVLGL